MADTLENIVLRLVERFMAGRFTERHGLVTSYDSQKHLAKVMYKPDDQESGWLPIETGHIGAGYGIATGLMPGDGKQSGDQVIVRFQEGDFESGKIVQRVHSNQDIPPAVASGESVTWTQGGQQTYFKGDGSLLHTDGQGAKVQMEGNGNVQIHSLKKDNSCRSDDHHSHIKFDGAAIWVDGGCWSCKPIQISCCNEKSKDLSAASAGQGEPPQQQQGSGH